MFAPQRLCLAYFARSNDSPWQRSLLQRVAAADYDLDRLTPAEARTARSLALHGGIELCFFGASLLLLASWGRIALDRRRKRLPSKALFGAAAVSAFLAFNLGVYMAYYFLGRRLPEWEREAQRLHSLP